MLTAGLGYFIFQNQKLLKNFSSSPTPQLTTSSPTATPNPASPSPSPLLDLDSVKENIEAAINSQNTAALETYMNSPVEVILQATECCGSKTPQEAVSQLSYIKGGIPFDFNQQNPTIKNLKPKNPELSSAFIGISEKTEHLIAFDFATNNKISSVRMSVSWKLFNN